MFHVLNQAVARLTIFEKPEVYAAFMDAVAEAWEVVPLAIYAICGDAKPLALDRLPGNQR